MYSILIIEDDPSLCANMKLILHMEGFGVTTAGDGQAGLEMIRENRPDLILCDIMMPLLDGNSLLELLTTEAMLADTAFIFVTALGERADVRRGMSAGADDYLTKPFSAEELVTAVTGRLRRLEMLRGQGGKTVLAEEHALLLQRVSPREQEVLLLVGTGATSKEIAERLDISLRTVEVHRSNLMSKLNVTNSAMLARWAIIAEQM